MRKISNSNSSSSNLGNKRSSYVISKPGLPKHSCGSSTLEGHVVLTVTRHRHSEPSSSANRLLSLLQLQSGTELKGVLSYSVLIGIL